MAMINRRLAPGFLLVYMAVVSFSRAAEERTYNCSHLLAGGEILSSRDLDENLHASPAFVSLNCSTRRITVLFLTLAS